MASIILTFGPMKRIAWRFWVWCKFLAGMLGLAVLAWVVWTFLGDPAKAVFDTPLANLTINDLFGALPLMLISGVAGVLILGCWEYLWDYLESSLKDVPPPTIRD